MSNNDDVEDIKDPQRIAALLLKAWQARALLNVSITGSSEIFTTAILSVDETAGDMLLDEFNSAVGHKLLDEQCHFRAIIRLKGVELSFRAQVTAVIPAVEKEPASYRVALPTLLRYGQRRGAYRVAVPVVSNPITVKVQRENGKFYEGKVSDISLGGIGAVFTKGFPTTFGDILPECHVRFPEGDVIRVQLEVRFAALDDDTGRLRFGGRFIQLGNTERRLLQRWVVMLDRQAARRRP